MTRLPMTVICQALRMARRTAYYATRARPGGQYHRRTDDKVLEQIRAVTNSRATYGYRPDALQPQAHSARHAAPRA